MAVEIQGWGRHQRFMGYEADCEKLATAASLGWRVLPITPRFLKTGPSWLVEVVQAALEYPQSDIPLSSPPARGKRISVPTRAARSRRKAK